MGHAYLLLVLHAHLPFVRHPEQPRFLEERWLFEAITECYLPLLGVLERLQRDGISHRLTLSLSPTLISMLDDDFLRGRYLDHLEALLELARQEESRHHNSPDLRSLARFHTDLYTRTRRDYLQRGRDLITAFRRQDQGQGLELITCAATHGFLPMLRAQPSAVRAQVMVARDLFTARLGRPSRGIWLPECGYYPGLEAVLEQAGLEHLFLETHGIEHARPRPPHGVATPIALERGLVAFGRDPACSESVWSKDTGYPGHPLYREFHRDIGYERSAGELGDLAGPGAAPVGIKYHRVTGRDSEHKELYDPPAAAAQARIHARAFVADRLAAAGQSRLRDRPPLFVAPFDAELFGHWWFEGPLWLEALMREVAVTPGLEMLSADDYLARHPVLYKADPPATTWGSGGYSGFWLDDSNAWLLPLLQQAAEDMRHLVRVYGDSSNVLQQRGLRQAGRELLLAQASDWPFIMRTGTAVEYALTSVQSRLSRFRYLQQGLTTGNIDEHKLEALEQMDKLFPDLDYRVFA